MKFPFLMILGLMLAGCSGGGSATSDQELAQPTVDPNNLSDEERPSKKGHLFSTLSHEQEEDVALAINLAGYLCGKFIGSAPVGSMILVECQEYRKKEGHYVRYWIRGLGEQQQMRVEKAFVLKPDGWQKVKS